MTVLERFKRKIQKATFLSRKSPVAKRAYSADVAARRQLFLRPQAAVALWARSRKRHWLLARKSASPHEPIGRIEIRMTTYRLMQTEVLHRISQGNGRSCTLFDAIEAIKSNKQIMESHAHDSSDFLLRLTWKRGQADVATTRKYELMAVLETMEAMPSACVDRVGSWEEVEIAFRAHMNFPSESSKEEEESFSNDPVERMMQRFEWDSQFKVKQRLEAVQQVVQTPPVSREAVLNETEQAPTQRYYYDEDQKPPASEELHALEKCLQLEDRKLEAEERASQLLRPLTPEQEQTVRNALFDIGPENDIVAKSDTDVITRKNMHTLQPGAWLSDEIIHFYLALLAKRDEELYDEDSTHRRSHFFKSFFMTKLCNEGHHDPDIAGKYEYKNVKRWSKKVPGKDIFLLDKVFFPINVGEIHWVCACAFMQEKRIQYYDSFGGDGMDYLKNIKRYIEDEHLDKKKTPLPESDEWQLIPCERGTPRQENGFDCGVFTCMFADFLSRDCPLIFGQAHVNQCRERIALSILDGRAFK